MKQLAIIVIVLILIGGIGTLWYLNSSNEVETNTAPTADEPMPVEPDGGIGDGAEPLSETDEEEMTERPDEEVIGTSAGGDEITAYHFGDGDREVLFVGGTHGGYSFNTALVGFELIDYLDSNPTAIPENVTVTVIPVLNPDGLEEVVGTTGRFDGDGVTANEETRVAGRFNANGVDINRNFDCEWQENATWQSRSVSGGSEPFSEPESRTIRDYVESNNIAAAVVYYSQAGGVYSSTCSGTISPETAELTSLYAEASGYPAYEEFDFYEITGDMVNWMAKSSVPAISVLLTDHENAEWSKNVRGVDAVLEYVAK